MAARPFVHDRATADVQDIAAHIARDNLDAALRFITAAERAIDRIAEFPGIGPAWEPSIPELTGLRFWPITRFRNYLVFYRLTPTTGVEVLRVLHGARDIAVAMRRS